MSGSIENKLASLGISLPKPATPIANYVPFVRSGNLLVVSGQLVMRCRLNAVGPDLSRPERRFAAWAA